jgi:beta-glucosidase
VRNTGQRAGDEVVQLYVRDEVASVTQPVKKLVEFQRVTLAAGESRTVRMTLDRRAFSLWNRQLEEVVEPGRFTIMAGPNSAELKSTVLEIA